MDPNICMDPVTDENLDLYHNRGVLGVYDSYQFLTEDIPLAP